MKRYAIVRNADSRRQIDAYLPDNYKVIHESDDEHNGRPGRRSHVFVIEGVDYAGWGLDTYVMPRCSSGSIWVEEIDLSHPIMKQIEVDDVTIKIARRDARSIIRSLDDLTRTDASDDYRDELVRLRDLLQSKLERKPHVHVDQGHYLDVIDEVGGEALLEDVAAYFDVSFTTARRNLDGLVAQGKLEKHDDDAAREGGVSYSLSAATIDDTERGSG
jgi:hypothetical protein